MTIEIEDSESAFPGGDVSAQFRVTKQMQPRGALQGGRSRQPYGGGGAGVLRDPKETTVVTEWWANGGKVEAVWER